MKYLVSAALLAAGFAIALSPPAAAQPAQSQACLAKNMVDGWKVVNDQTLIVNDRVGRKFTVTLQRGCRDLKWPDRLGWTSSTGFAIGCIQHNDFLYVPPNGGNIAQRCLIKDVQPGDLSQQADAGQR
jgi:hypothetical protein